MSIQSSTNESVDESGAVGMRLAVIRESEAQSQAAFAKALGLSLRGYQNYERGLRAPTDVLIRALWGTFGVDPVWLLTGKGPMRRSMTYPTKEEIMGKGNGWMGDAPPGRKNGAIPLFEHWAGMLDWVRTGVVPDQISRVQGAYHVGPRAFALPVRGKSMEPAFPCGARIVIDPDLPEKSGTYVVVRVEGWDEATFRRLVKEAGRTYLEPLAEGYRIVDITDEAYTYCGRVVRLERDYT